MLKKAAIIFGVALLFLGLLGSLSNGMLLGLFAVTAAQNTFYIVSGLLAILLGWAGSHAARLCFQLLTILYGFLALYGLFVSDTVHHLSIAWLHALIAAVGGYFGFVCPLMKPKPRADAP